MLTEPPDDVDVLAARADVASAESAAADAQESLANATITAPFAGTVAAMTATAGQTVELKESLGVLSDLNALRVLVNIPQSDVSVVQAGMAATVTFDSFAGVKLTGKLDTPERTPSVVQGVVFYKGHIVLDPGQLDTERLSPGLTASVTISALNLENTIVVPLRVLSGTAERRTVRVLGDNGAIEERVVTLGQRGDNGVEIAAGLRAGDRVVVSGGTSAGTSPAGPGATTGGTTRSGAGTVRIPGIGGGPPG